MNLTEEINKLYRELEDENTTPSRTAQLRAAIRELKILIDRLEAQE